MSDFEMFESDFNNVPADEDPAADFLAREQDELAGLEDDNLGLSSEVQQPFTSEDSPPVNGFVQPQQMNGPSDPFPATVTSRPVTREEPQKIRIWREEQQQMLEVKDAEEEIKKKELKESAKKELDDWYTRYREQIEKAKLNNRNAEKEWVAERDAESPGQEWERIARLCDFNPKSSRSTKDTTRMRSIILQLKQSPIPPRK